MGQSTGSRARGKAKKGTKPPKPFPGFPLYLHRSGRYAKKIRGETKFFGRWGHKVGPDIVPVEDLLKAAELAKAEYERQAPYLFEGKDAPKVEPDTGPDIFDLREQFLDAKDAAVNAGRLSPRTFSRYKKAANTLKDFFGEEFPLSSLGAAEFTRLHKSLDQGQNPVSLANDIRHIRIVCKFAYDSELIDKPIRYGPVFKAPPQDVIRREGQAHQRQHGKRLIDAPDLREILNALAGIGEWAQPQKPANVALRAMVLLGVNCGFGQSDVANLEESHLDLEKGWVDFPRVKTAVERRVPLWPETVEALREALRVRPKARSRDDASCVFITRYRGRWVSVSPNGCVTDTVGACFTRLLTAMRLKRLRLGFYALRHATETIGGRTRDKQAVDRVMGHAPAANDMGARYIEDFEDDRLLNVTNTIRGWLFGGAT